MMSDDGLQRTIQDPAIPYVGTIIGGLQPGSMVVIHGIVLCDADRFQIDFQCGSSEKPRSDVAFHFNPRYKRSGQIVCNTLQNGGWGWEEVTYLMPFTKGQPFEVIFFVFQHKFQVSGNGRHLLSYKHRISLEKIDSLSISGKVKIGTIGFAQHTSQQGSQPASLAASMLGGCLSVPYKGTLPSSLGPGKTVLVKGEIKKNPKRFVIDLKPSGSKDIALHLNPRMKERVFVRNTYLCDSWGEEERQLHDFPFSPDMYFELLVHCEAHQFKVAVNGLHLLAYQHRFKDLGKINEIAVDGDIELYDVRVW
ncbi:galectin-8 [Hyperolius riggenbachi]|uniref:galectin-8 n=1 Tax=Hyperolius riggenbachi TaxID=752182 RepID=UPI0035A38251